MPYHLEYHELNVVPFLEDEGRVSPAMRRVIETSLEVHWGQHADFYRLNPAYRIPGRSGFTFDLILTDPETGRQRRFDFVVSDAAVASGVLRVLFMEEKMA